MLGYKLVKETKSEEAEVGLSKKDLEAVLGAAGLSLADAYNRAISNLETTARVQQERINSNSEIIVKAEAAIDEASDVLDKTNATLDIVRKLA